MLFPQVSLTPCFKSSYQKLLQASWLLQSRPVHRCYCVLQVVALRDEVSSVSKMWEPHQPDPSFCRYPSSPKTEYAGIASSYGATARRASSSQPSLSLRKCTVQGRLTTIYLLSQRRARRNSGSDLPWPRCAQSGLNNYSLSNDATCQQLAGEVRRA